MTWATKPMQPAGRSGSPVEPAPKQAMPGAERSELRRRQCSRQSQTQEILCLYRRGSGRTPESPKGGAPISAVLVLASFDSRAQPFQTSLDLDLRAHHGPNLEHHKNLRNPPLKTQELANIAMSVRVFPRRKNQRFHLLPALSSAA